MELVSLAQHSAWLGAGERPEKPSYSKRTARPQPRYMPACGAENGASTRCNSTCLPTATLSAARIDAFARSFGRSLLAERRSERTIDTYCEALESLRSPVTLTCWPRNVANAPSSVANASVAGAIRTAGSTINPVTVGVSAPAMRARRGMGFVGETWRLYHEQELLGQLVITDADFPWLRARFQAEPGFEMVRPLFEEELRLLDTIDDGVDAWEAAYGQVRDAVSLAAPDGRRVPEFLLHIQGENAWWRWNDEPFPA